MLNIIQVRAAKPRERVYTLSDGEGLFLRIELSGAKHWIYNRSIGGQKISRQLGTFPDMTLRQARDAAEALTQQLRLSPASGPATVQTVYTEWLRLKQSQVKNWKDIDLRMQRYILPRFGALPFCELLPGQLIETLKVELGSRGKLETVKRICSYIKAVEVFALNSGVIEQLRLQNLAAVFPAPSTAHRNRPSIPYAQLPEVLPRLQELDIKSHASWSALLCGFYTLLRPGEYTQLRWEWIDLDSRVLTVPEEVMKMKRPHTVPLSRQLLELLEGLPRLSDYVFPSVADVTQPVTTNSLSLLLRRNGFEGVLVPHGIRAIGRSWMFDSAVPFEVAELCLAHSVGTATVKAYIRSDRLEERREAMQRWCDYVELCLRGGASLLL